MNRNLLFSALFLFGAQQINAQDVTFGLVSKYTFDNQDVTDQVGVNDGGAQDVFYSSPGYGSTGSAIFFDGYDPNGPFPTVGLAGVQSEIIDISQSFTISFWFNLTEFNPNRNMVLLSSRGNGLGQEAGGIEFTLNGADNTLNVYGRSISGGFALEYQLTSPEIQNTLTWYFVTFTRNNQGSYKLYLNGSEVDELTTANVAEQNNLWSIGCTPNVPAREFQGSIDEVRFYDRVISSGEVTQLYNYTPMTVSIDEAEANSDVRVYPNPANDVLNFTISERSEYTLLDISGKTIMTGFVNPDQSLDVSNLVDGMYVVEVRSRDQLNRFKVLKK
jgi:hypothetical protein